jgi:putative PIN family toxin of toxin-antitoxin system
VRAVLDVNVLISTLLSPSGSPAQLLLAWQAGEFELVVSPALLAELRRALAYPKIVRLVPPDDGEAFVAWLSRTAALARDPSGAPPICSPDPNDDYLLALAAEQQAVLVTGDRHLLGVAGNLPVHTPADFLAMVSRPVG